MYQNYDKYTKEDQEVWRLLFSRQEKNMIGKADPIYLRCLNEMGEEMNAEAIPDFRMLNKYLQGRTGWTIEVVPGLIPVEDFFTLLSEKKWCSSTWLRTKKELDYLEEPDMFHDIFGHLPLLSDDVFAGFMQRFGILGKQNLSNTAALTALQRLYWFTVEFGLSGTNGREFIYGAGILSSYGETNHVTDDKVAVLPFDLNSVVQHSFVNSEIQNTYYRIDGFEQLYEATTALEELLERGLKIEPDIVR